MANKLEPLVIQLQADVAQALAQLDMVKGKLSQLESSAHSSHSAFGAFGEQLKEVGKIAVAAFGVMEIVKFLGETATAATAANKSFNLMSLQLQNSTGATREYSEEVDKQLEKMSLATGTLMPELRDNFSKLVRVTHDASSALKLESLAQNIAAGTGKELGVVSQALARAHEGNWMALNKLVPGVKNASDKMAYLEQTFNGAAEAAAKADPYMRMKAAMESIQVSIGNAFIPILQSMAESLANVAPKITEMMKSFTASPEFLSFVNDFLPNAVKWLGDMGDRVLPILSDAAGIVGSSIKLLTGDMNDLSGTKSGIMGLLDSVKALFDFLNQAFAGLGTWQKGVDDFFRTWASLGPVSEAVALGFKMAFGPITNTINLVNSLISAISQSGNMINNLAKALTNFKNSVLGLGAATGMDIFKGYGARPDTYRPPVKIPTLPGGGGGAGSGAKAVSAAQQIRNAIVNYYAAAAAELAKRNAAMATALSNHAAKIADITAKGRDSLVAIVQKSKDLLRNAFQQATQINVGSMFLDAGANIDNLLTMMSNKLKANKQLADDAGKLAGLGYSQEFIQSIIAQGPQTGDALAQQLLSGGADKAKEVQSMFDQVQKSSAHGVDSIADEIFKNAGIANEQLKNQYVQAQQDLVASLTAENDAYKKSANDLVRAYEVAMAKLVIARDKAKIAALQVGGVTKSEAKQIAAINREIAGQQGIVNAGGTTNINTNVTAVTNASAQQIASDVVNSIKFNAPVVVK